MRVFGIPYFAILAASLPGETGDLPGTPSLPLNSLLPPIQNDPTIDAKQWEAYQDNSEFTPWREWTRPMTFLKSKQKKNLNLPRVSTFLPPTSLFVDSAPLHQINFSGNTVFSDTELAEITAPFLLRALTLADLDQIASLITRHYIRHQYFNSGTRITEEDIQDGILTIPVTEGTLEKIVLSGNKALKSSFIKNRLLGKDGAPLHFPDLSRRVQILQQDPNIQRINAELKPGPYPGSAFLEVDLLEKDVTWKTSLSFNNHRPSSIGAEQLDLSFSHTNLTGVSDDFYFRYGLLSGGLDDPEFSGLDNFSISYSRPITASDTTLHFNYQRQDYTILEEPFNALDISGDTQKGSLGISHPIIHTLNDRISLDAYLEHSRSYSELLGEPFSLSSGHVDGKLSLTTLRLGAEWTRRQTDYVFALRSHLVAGIPEWGSTEAFNGPETSFLSVQLSAQYLKRIPDRQDILLIRSGAQFAFDDLPSPQKTTLGGHSSVRGFRENSLVRDSGAYLGLEYQYRLFPENKNSSWKLFLIPFIDAGHAWDYETSQSETIASAGLGFRATYSEKFQADLFWGTPLTSSPDTGDSLQDQGLHFQLNLFDF